MHRGDLLLSDDPQKGGDERLAAIERDLKHLKAGLGLLGVAPCGSCGIYYRLSDPGALFDCGEFVCWNCVSRWWLRRCPELSTRDRPMVERELRQWLVGYHHAKVIGKLGDLPEPEWLLLKLVTGCEQCEGSGKTYSGHHCQHCDGRGTVWVVVEQPT